MSKVMVRLSPILEVREDLAPFYWPCQACNRKGDQLELLQYRVWPLYISGFIYPCRNCDGMGFFRRNKQNPEFAKESARGPEDQPG